MKPFMGIDGESYTVDGEHRYVLLMNSQGQHIYSHDGLSTIECFEYLLTQDRNYIYVAFGLNYDVNMMLRDLGRAALKDLWTLGKIRWREYYIEWIPGKWFKVSSDKHRKPIKLNETFGFFQMSFIKALDKWNIQVQDADELETMKASRSIFDADMTQRMTRYCQTECELLVTLMDALRQALLAVNIKLSSWNGAGSIAASILKREGVKDTHSPHNELPEDIQHACLSAYFGGRTELFRQGHYDIVSQYDICSAYPHGALSLPVLLGGKWQKSKTYKAQAKHAIWEVRWNIHDTHRIAPFPYRNKAAICYPYNGRGWYHACEVAEALKHYPDQIEILQGWIFTPISRERPFSFIVHLYKYRHKLKAEGHAGEKCIKLGINSLYGKLAQGIGYRDQLPPFQSYFWAGEITARTRARILQLIWAAPDSTIMVATDGIFYEGDVKHATGKELGDLEYTHLTDVFTAQPGVYKARDGDTEVKRSRGFFAREIDFDSLQEGYNEEGPYHIGHYKSTRFVGAGTALMSKTLDAWRTWRETERKLSLYPSTKIIADSESRPVIHLPPRLPEPVIPSEPYKPKIKGYADDEIDYNQGKEQPLRT